MPESTRNIHDRVPISVMVDAEPTIHTISHEKMSTITVRTAVATSESVFFMPHFASTAVRPAKSAEPNANTIHIVTTFFSDILHVKNEYRLVRESNSI